jgi:DNA-binding NarL/FixJ family response regulator
VTANRAQVLILGVPGRMQECLKTLLNAIPQLEVKNADREHWPPNGLEAEKIPDLVVLDSGLAAPEALEYLTWIHVNWSAVRSLILVNTAQQQLVARAAGAHEVLIKGFSAAEFFAAVKSLLNGRVTFSPELSPSAMPDQTEGATDYSRNLNGSIA